MKRLMLLTAALLLLALPALAELTEQEDDFSLDELFSDVPETVQQQVVSTRVEDDGTIVEDLEEVSIYEDDGSIRITVTATGDFTIGGDSRKSKSIWADELNKRGGDPNYTLANVRDILASDDLTLVNFEGTLTDTTYVPSSKKNNQFLFSAPPSYASILSDNSVEAVSL